MLDELVRWIVVPDGTNLVEALASSAGDSSGWLQAAGQVDGAEILVAGEHGATRRPLDGPWTLASCQGPAGGPYGVTLSRVGKHGLEVVAGLLVRARARGISAVLLRSSAPPMASATTQAAKPTWGAAALGVQPPRAQEPEDEELELPQTGDRIHHFAFGLCDVLASDGDSLKIRDAENPGRVREIRLGPLRVLPPTVEDGRRVFRLERGRNP